METWFYRLSCHGQLAAGLLLFAISLALEQQVLARYLGSVVLATVLAVGLEASKVLTIVLHRVLSNQRETGYPASVRYLALLFRAGLLALSALCSVMYLGHRLDRPSLETVRAADVARLEQTAGQEREVLDRRAAEDAARAERTARESIAALRATLEARYLPAIRTLEHALSAEMDNVVNGIFEGPRYRALGERLAEEKRAYDARLADLAVRERDAVEQAVRAVRDAHRERLAELEARVRSALAALRTSDYGGDPRVEDPMVVAFLRTLTDVGVPEVTPVRFVFLFSLFLSVILELGILVSFENLTGAHIPVLAAEHKVNLQVQRRRVEAGGELAEERIHDRARRARTRAWVDDAVADLAGAHEPCDDKLAGSVSGMQGR